MKRFWQWAMDTAGFIIVGVVFVVFALAFGWLMESETAKNVGVGVGLAAITALVWWGMRVQRRNRHR